MRGFFYFLYGIYQGITPLPKEWEESGEVFQQTLPVDDHWWKSFQDTKLDSLIALAVDRNYSVAMAINRIAAARANLWAERGNFFPSIGLNAGWTDRKPVEIPVPYLSLQIIITMLHSV